MRSNYASVPQFRRSLIPNSPTFLYFLFRMGMLSTDGGAGMLFKKA